MKAHLVSVDNKIQGYVEPGSMMLMEKDGSDIIGALMKISDAADAKNEYRISANGRKNHQKFDGKVVKVSGVLTDLYPEW